MISELADREDLMDVAYIKQSGSELRMQCVVCN